MKPASLPETPVHDFTVRGALWCAEQGRLAAWVRAYLDAAGVFHGDLGENSDYHERLAAWFEREERFWAGPLELPLRRLIRRFGPEEAMPWNEPRETWERRVTAIQNAFSNPSEMPPLIAHAVEAEPGEEGGRFTLLLNDGAHRHEALKRLGQTAFWVIVWFDSAAQQQAFLRGR